MPSISISCQVSRRWTGSRWKKYETEGKGLTRKRKTEERMLERERERGQEKNVRENIRERERQRGQEVLLGGSKNYW